MRDVIQTLIQSSGLRFINWLARSGGYRIKTMAYGNGDRHQMDWFLVDENLPTVIFFHGGNWRSGCRQDYRFVADTLCQMNVNALIPDFPLYPEYRFKDILAGAAGAVNCFMRNVSDNSMVVLMGHSSGAQMAALLALDSSLLHSSERVCAMIGLSGPYDFFPFTDEDHWDLFAPEEEYPRSQPVNYVNPESPPLYLLHGREDLRVRRGHSKSLMEKQLNVGGFAAREVYKDMGHVDAVLSFSRIHRRNSPLIRDIHSYFDKLFKED